MRLRLSGFGVRGSVVWIGGKGRGCKVGWSFEGSPLCLRVGGKRGRGYEGCFTRSDMTRSLGFRFRSSALEATQGYLDVF